jgi:uncharacterized protein (UPF0332 family)
MSLLDKSKENARIAKKCLSLAAYSAGISRAYYAVFQTAEYTLRNSGVFNYGAFLTDNNIEGRYIPHGKMQKAVYECALGAGKTVKLGRIAIYDNLYHKRRKADYTDKVCTEEDLNESIREMESILKIIT